MYCNICLSILGERQQNNREIVDDSKGGVTHLPFVFEKAKRDVLATHPSKKVGDFKYDTIISFEMKWYVRVHLFFGVASTCNINDGKSFSYCTSNKT